MRYEGWTYRETVVRLAEHRELREAVGLQRVPHWTTLQKFLARLPEGVLSEAIAAAARRLLPPDGGGDGIGAADATGLRTSRASVHFLRRLRHRGQESRQRGWVKLTVLVTVRPPVILAATAARGPGAEAPDLPPLVRRGLPLVPLRVVLADAGYDSERNHRLLREELGVTAIIPPRTGRPPRPGRWPGGYRGEMARHFPQALYRRRVLVETVLSVLKRKMGDVVAGQGLPMQARQALLLALTYNLYRLKLYP
jgi:hypothetical protein